MAKCVVTTMLAMLLLGWPSTAENQQSNSHKTSQKSAQNKQPAPPIHVVIDPPLPAASGKPESTSSQNQSAEKPLPRFERPEWVIVYVTLVYAFIAWLTLIAIKRQANTMESQLADARETGTHTETLAQQAVRQSDLTQRQFNLANRPWISIDF